MLNELRAAIIEREIVGSIALFSTGQRLTSIQALRNACFNLIKRWTWYYVDWTNETTYTIRRLTTEASDPSEAPFSAKNIFELAFGDEQTTWPSHTGDGSLTADDLNDIYTILDLLRCFSVSVSSAGTPINGYRELSYASESCSACLSALDSVNYTKILERVHAVGISGRQVYGVIEYLRPCQARGGFYYYFTPPVVAKAVYLNPLVRAYRVRSSPIPDFMWPVYYPLARTIELDVRFGTGSMLPDNWAGARAFGSSIGTIFASVDNDRSLVFRQVTNSDQRVNFCIVVGDYNASGSSLCGLWTPPPALVSLTEVASVSSVLVIVEPDYQKLTAEEEEEDAE